MELKVIVVLAAFVAVSQAVVIGAPGPYQLGAYGLPAIAKVAAPVVAKVAEPYDPNPQYSYSYDVHDALTGDAKSQQESRSGDVVQGSYSLIEPDGTRRVVEYTADPVNGFNAVVHREPVATKVVTPVAKIGIAAPLGIAKIASPYAQLAPVAKIATPLGHLGPYGPYGPVGPLGYPSLLQH